MTALRPYAIIRHGVLEPGAEVLFDGKKIVNLRSLAETAEPYVLSAAFVNAHSHLEYRGFQDRIDEREYWGWIRELTRLKGLQAAEEVRSDCLVAAKENRATGVALIAEHSDRPFAGEAMTAAGLKGAIFQEVITRFGKREERLEEIERNAAINRSSFSGPVWLSPHAYQTVDDDTLRSMGESGDPISSHVAETPYESMMTREGSGPIADYLHSIGIPYIPTGKGIIETLQALGLLRPRAQVVHCCALEPGDIELIATSGASVAHCPRSNVRLRCEVAPIRQLLDAGVTVGLGLDSAASSGSIDMFAEMRACLEVSRTAGAPVSAEETWRMATSGGYESVRFALRGNRESWDIATGSTAPLIKINVPDASSIEDLIERGSPGAVEWVTG